MALVGLFSLEANAQETLENVRFTVEHFKVVGDNPIGDAADSILEPFTGEQYGLEGLSAAADALGQAIIDAGFNFHRVSLPPQQLFSGTVKLKVSRFAIGKITIEGNRFFDKANILHSVPELILGETPNTRELSRSLKISNTHSSKSTVLRFKEGEEADSIDAELTIKDRNPQVFFITLDNTGPENGEIYRTTLGYQHGNLFNLDHSITATVTTAPEEPSTTTQVGINYHIPMYQHGASLDILFSDSEANSVGATGSSVSSVDGVSTGEVSTGKGLEITGSGTVVGLVYTRPMLTSGSFNHQWSIGLQHKNFDNKSSFNLIDYQLVSDPLELGYAFTRQGPGSSLSGGFTLVAEVGDDSKDYTQDRAEAESGWSAVRYNLAYDFLIGKEWLLHMGLSGQSTSNLLISGEQFGVGGVGSLRGFEERSVTGDSGYQATVELWMPPIASYSLRYSIFFDFANTEFNDGMIAGNEGVSYDLASAGVSMFWSWRQNLSLSLNYGVINQGGGADTSINQDGNSKLHMSLVYRF